VKSPRFCREQRKMVVVSIKETRVSRYYSNATAANSILSTKWARVRESCHDTVAGLPLALIDHPIRVWNLPSSPHAAHLSQLLRISTMEAESRRPKGQEDTILVLNKAIEASNPAKVSSSPPAMAVFGSVSVLLTLIRTVCFLLSRNDLLHWAHT
jgi:hypothetical protein